MTPEEAFEEKRVAYSRENEPAGLCDCCVECPDECGREERACMEDAAEDWGEREFRARKERAP